MPFVTNIGKYDFSGRKASFFVKKIYKLVESETQMT
jgi:hypothetical protein